MAWDWMGLDWDWIGFWSWRSCDANAVHAGAGRAAPRLREPDRLDQHPHQERATVQKQLYAATRNDEGTTQLE